MKRTQSIVVSTGLLVFSACSGAPESSVETSAEGDRERGSLTHVEDVATLSRGPREPEPAVCACHVPELNGKLRCVASCPVGMACETKYKICVKD